MNQVTVAAFVLVACVLVNGILARCEVTGLLRELTRLSVLLSLGYLIFVLIKRPSKPKS